MVNIYLIISYEYTYKLDNKNYDGYGRTENEAKINAIKNVLEILI